MLQSDIKLMLSSLTEDKKALRKLCDTGYFSYSNKSTKGGVAIVNNEILISLVEDIHDESKAIATVSSLNRGTYIFKLFNENYAQHQFDVKNPYKENGGGFYMGRLQGISKNKVASEISLIREYFAKIQEKSDERQAHPLRCRITSIFKNLERKPKRNILILLQETIEKLNKCKNLDEQDSLLKKVAVHNPINDNNTRVRNLNLDKTR